MGIHQSSQQKEELEFQMKTGMSADEIHLDMSKLKENLKTSLEHTPYIPGSRTSFQTHEYLDQKGETVTVDSPFLDCETIQAIPNIKNKRVLCSELEALLPVKPEKLFLHDQFEVTLVIQTKTENPKPFVVSIHDY